jgi:glycosyltransferase involved in cell wall biosynthesis
MVALPGKLLVIVLPGAGAGAGAGDAAATVAAFARNEVPNLTVKTAVVQGARLDAANVAARASADYLAFVPAGVTWPAEHLERCVHQLRSDLSVGLVGGSATGAPDGSLDLFVPLGGAIVRHSAFHAIEGFDPAFDLLTDVDFGWRLWLRGYRVRSAGPVPPGVPSAVGPPDRLPDATRSLLARVLDDTSLAGEPWSSSIGTAARRAAAGRRLVIQRSRERGDGELLPLAHAAVARWVAHEPAAAPVAEVLATWGAPDRAGPRRRIAVVTSDTLAPRMAGPGIRALQIARRLAADHEVILATTERCELEVTGFQAVHVGEKGLRDLERWCDIFLFQGWVMAGRDYLAATDKMVVADVYDPMHLEQLEQGHDAEGERGRFEAVRNASTVLNDQLARADFMLCASTKQRDLWLGQLAGLGRINPVVYDGDESLRSLLAVVPFGVGDEPPVATRHAIRGTIPGIGPDDHVVLWGGGVYNWFDPLTLVRAIDRLRHRLPTVRLLFLGMRHPNPGIPEMRMAVETQRLAEELGLVDEHVFFNRTWVDFDDRQNYLLDADVGVSTHLDHIETEFSFRTRILDYLWAGLPIVATDGDSFAEVILREDLGLVVPAGDVEALEDALARLLGDRELAEACQLNILRVIPAMRWESVLEPLVEFCAAPSRAPDGCCPDLRPPERIVPITRGWRRDVDVTVQYLRAGASGLLVRRALDRLRHRRG